MGDSLVFDVHDGQFKKEIPGIRPKISTDRPALYAAAAVLKRLAEGENGSRYERLCRLLSKVVEGVKRVEYQSIGKKETIAFKQDVGLKNHWTVDSLNMSDGTLRRSDELNPDVSAARQEAEPLNMFSALTTRE
jgi:hypothetical protein